MFNLVPDIITEYWQGKKEDKKNAKGGKSCLKENWFEQNAKIVFPPSAKSTLEDIYTLLSTLTNLGLNPDGCKYGPEHEVTVEFKNFRQTFFFVFSSTNQMTIKVQTGTAAAGAAKVATDAITYDDIFADLDMALEQKATKSAADRRIDPTVISFHFPSFFCRGQLEEQR